MPAVVLLKPLISKLPFPFVIARAVPPSDVPSKDVLPPKPPFVPPKLMSVAVPALDAPLKTVEPPGAPSADPPEFMIVVLPVIVVPEEKTVEPAGVKAAAKISGVSVSFGGGGGGRAAPPLLTIVCPLSELFAMPVPWIVSVFPSVLIVKAPAPAPKLIPAALMAVASVTVPPV